MRRLFDAGSHKTIATLRADGSGEAKIAGRAVLAELIGEGPAGDLFVAGIFEVVTTRLNPGRRCWSSSRGR